MRMKLESRKQGFCYEALITGLLFTYRTDFLVCQKNFVSFSLCAKNGDLATATALTLSTATHLGGMDDTEGVGLGKLMQLQFRPDREHF